ncbi:MAG: LysR family transcriptional regulator [Rhizobiales bacterium]|nr:LysR family transcriptional regulator [Hyphomicrobiales bacterium]
MSDTLALYQTFLRVVEAGSFTAIANERNTSQPTISRHIAALEDHLGCLLFHRTTRSLTLTDDGRQFYEQARVALDAVASAESAVGKRKGKPTGRLKLSCAVVMGRLQILPRLPRFLARYPDVEVDLSMSDGFTDLVEEGIDLAIRVGELTDPGLIARRIGTTRRVVAATPEYLARKGEPRTPAELADHDCIIYSRLATGANWPFMTAEGTTSIAVKGRLHVNNTEGVRAAVLNGVGIGILPLWHFVDREIETGKVKVLLTKFETKSHPINAVYPSRRHLSLKVRAMIDFLAAEFELDPKLSGYGG